MDMEKIFIDEVAPEQAAEYLSVAKKIIKVIREERKMKQLVVVTTTDDQDLITFSVIHRQQELLYGRLRWEWFGVNFGEKVDVVVNCYQRPAPGERWDSHGLEGYYEAILNSNEWNGNKREQLRDDCIKKCICRAIPDGKIVRIINI